MHTNQFSCSAEHLPAWKDTPQSLLSAVEKLCAGIHLVKPVVLFSRKEKRKKEEKEKGKKRELTQC